MTVSLSSELVLACTASGIPVPNITWIFNSSLVREMIPSSSDVITSYGIIQSQLHINQIELSDLGQYQCQAESSEYSPVVSNIALVNVVGKCACPLCSNS